ncbi:hypothetical protein SAMN04488510_1397 [Fervidobacterium changbaicum]|nr:hypothetical protein SAMN04488510_1397 [Fervidobacterium changbaicum]
MQNIQQSVLDSWFRMVVQIPDKVIVKKVKICASSIFPFVVELPALEEVAARYLPTRCGKKVPSRYNNSISEGRRAPTVKIQR